MSTADALGPEATAAGGAARRAVGAGPNLARRPFVNARPVTRSAVLLWLLGAGLLIANVFSVSAYLVGSAEKRQRLAELEGEIATELRRGAALTAELEGLDLEELNERVAFLNRRIAERTFTWGRLFDDISEVLPEDVRIVGISPLSIAREQAARAPRAARGGRDANGAAGAADADDANPEFPLAIIGVARSAEPLLDFIDALFARPDFAHPDLASEEAATDGLAFSATATYRPRRDEPGAGAVLEEVPPPAPEPTVAPDLEAPAQETAADETVDGTER